MELGATVGQGTGAPNAQPPASGQGIGADSGVQPDTKGSGFNWGFYPNVPEEHRPLLEPHLKGVQGHVTQLEQQLAPWRSLTEAGYSPQDIQGLVQFSETMDQDPVGTWLRIGEKLQEDGQLHGELDLSAVQAIAQGQEVEGIETPEVGEGEEVEDDAITQLQERIEELEGMLQQDQRSRQEAVEDRALDNLLVGMKEHLKAAGFPEEILNGEHFDRELTAKIVTFQGDHNAVLQSMTGLREGILKGHVQTKQSPDLKLPKGSPRAPEKKSGRTDPWSVARQGASDHLARAAEAEAQNL